MAQEKSVKISLSNPDQAFIREIEQILAPYFVKTRFKAGRILWNEGDRAGKMVSLVSGKVKIFRSLANGKQAAIFIFGPGDTFGFMPLIDGSPYPASAEIMEDSQALVMTREKLHIAMKQDPEIAIFLIRHLAKRLREAFDQIERLSTRGVIPRTAAALISLAILPGEEKHLEVISLPVSSREYAALIGLTPESFSRGITRLVDLGVIHRLKPNAIQILDFERLLSESRPET